MMVRIRKRVTISNAPEARETGNREDRGNIEQPCHPRRDECTRNDARKKTIEEHWHIWCDNDSRKGMNLPPQPPALIIPYTTKYDDMIRFTWILK